MFLLVKYLREDNLPDDIWRDIILREDIGQEDISPDVLPIQEQLKQEILSHKPIFYREMVSVNLEILFGIYPFRDLLSEIYFLYVGHIHE